MDGSPFWIYDDNILQGSLKLSEHAVPGEAISFGGAVAASLEVAFRNPDGLYDGIRFSGAQVNPSVGLVLTDYEWFVKIACDAIIEAVFEGLLNSGPVKITAYSNELSMEFTLYNFDTGEFSDMMTTGATEGPPYAQTLVVPKNTIILNLGETNFNVPPAIMLTGDIAATETEWVPLGAFLVDGVEHAIPYQRSPVNSIKLLAMDNMIRFEQAFSNVGIGFPATAGTLLTAVCAFCGVARAPGAISFMNSDYVIAARPEGEMSCRDIVGYIAELAGCFARCTRTGELDFAWFQNPAAGTPDTELAPLGRIGFGIDDTPITISGVSYETDDGILRVGEDSGEYDITLSDNPLIAADPEPVLQSLYGVVEGFEYLPYHTTRHDDPALRAGDMVLHSDVNGIDYKSVITAYEYKYQGLCNVVGSGLSQTVAGWRSTFQKRISTLSRRISNIAEPQMDAFADAVGLAFGMLAGVTGGYTIFGNDLGDPQFAGKTFLADDPDLQQAQDIWQYSLAGIAHYTNGINSPPQSAWTGNGRLVIPIVNATQITTGTLSSNNGLSWIDLDTGAFSFAGGLITYDSVSGSLYIQNPFNEYLRFEGANIELGRADSDTKVTITNNGFYINQSGIDSLYLRDGRAHVQELQVENCVYFANWAMLPMSNGNLADAWIGGQ